jgi:hypothetical protein
MKWSYLGCVKSTEDHVKTAAYDMAVCLSQLAKDLGSIPDIEIVVIWDNAIPAIEIRGSSLSMRVSAADL